MPPEERRVVWSSQGPGATPPAGAPGGPAARPEAAGAKGAAPAGRVRVRLERQGRGGKAVTVVENLPGHPARIEELGRLLKARCGAGGTVKGRLVEVQGDQRDKIVQALRDLGLDAVRAGG